jgi:hypothetical protein
MITVTNSGSSLRRGLARLARRSHAMRLALATTAAMTLAVALAPAAFSSSRESAPSKNPAPAVVPALHDWTGGIGDFTLDENSRILVQPHARDATDRQLIADAETFRDDLRAITGRELPVVVGARARPGDITLAVTATSLPAQGYSLDVDSTIAIDGSDTTGTFYGEQTVEQILKADPAHRRVPRGNATDWPSYGYRGVMIDLGRHYYQPSYVNQLIRQAAWEKLDEVHLHLTEADGFRLQLPGFPGLASAASYTGAQVTSWVREAQRYHVTLLPEVDLPAHASPITAYDPSLAWDCPSMNTDPVGTDPDFTIDITKPAATAFATKLIDELAALFPNSPVLHLGGDEYPNLTAQGQCPELVSYAHAHGFASTEDVFVAWQNQIAKAVTALGRRPEIWNWWDRVGGADILPSSSFIIDGWTTTPDSYLAEGYSTVSSPENILYVTPRTEPGDVVGGSLATNDAALYTTWQPEQNANLLGYEIVVWSDDAETQPDAYFTWFSRRGQQVVADRLWGGARYANLFAFQDAADVIGPPPGVTDEPAGVDAADELHGTPFGSGPANDGDSYDKAFDGDVATFVDDQAPSGGYVGIDLGAGHAARVTQIRFVPAGPSATSLSRMTGGVFEGCATGPDQGCQTIATIPWTPSGYEWLTVTVTDPHAYRWLRYVGPDGGHCDVAEIQFYGTSRH